MVAPCHAERFFCCGKYLDWGFFFLIHRSHSISFTRAQGIPKYKIGFGREKDGLSLLPLFHAGGLWNPQGTVAAAAGGQRVLVASDIAWGPSPLSAPGASAIAVASGPSHCPRSVHIAYHGSYRFLQHERGSRALFRSTCCIVSISGSPHQLFEAPPEPTAFSGKPVNGVTLCSLGGVGPVAVTASDDLTLQVHLLSPSIAPHLATLTLHGHLAPARVAATVDVPSSWRSPHAAFGASCGMLLEVVHPFLPRVPPMYALHTSPVGG